MSVPVDYHRHGQATWLDTISRKLMHTGTLGGWIDSGVIYGVTSNPTIFGQSIEKNDGDYNSEVAELAGKGASAFDIYDALTRSDIAEGADLFRKLHDANPVDGWISLEVLPSLARETDKTIAEAVRLNRALARPNVFIKVPSTPEGIPAIRSLIGSGISVNVTLMFNRKHYRDVATAYVRGLQDLDAKGGDVSKVHSVASFFVSRVDTLIDSKLEAIAAKAETGERDRILALRGKAGLANSKIVYQDYLALFGGDDFTKLKAKGARVQRPLWASTGTKNPAYSDLLYVENLVGPDTVNTMPQKTLEALLDHGRMLGDTIFEGLDDAHRLMDELKQVGVDVEDVGEELQVKGVELFSKSYDDLLATIESRRMSAVGETARAGVAGA